jgi:hypothetical protein
MKTLAQEMADIIPACGGATVTKSPTAAFMAPKIRSMLLTALKSLKPVG